MTDEQLITEALRIGVIKITDVDFAEAGDRFRYTAALVPDNGTLSGYQKTVIRNLMRRCKSNEEINFGNP